MQISSTQLKSAKLPPRVASAAAPAEKSTEPTDSFTFSDNSLSTKEMVQIGTIGAAGGLIGAIPGVGTASGLAGMAANGPDDQLGALIGLASAVTNVAATVAVAMFEQSPYLLAVPAVTGAITWGGLAYNSATS